MREKTALKLEALINLQLNNINKNFINSEGKYPLITIPCVLSSELVKPLYLYDLTDDDDLLIDASWTFARYYLPNISRDAESVTQAVSQLRIRIKLFRDQLVYTNNNKSDSSTDFESSTCYLSEVSIAASGDAPVLLPLLLSTTSQMLIHHALRANAFRTIVINLLHNSARRNFMIRQVKTARLNPAYLMPGVVDLHIPQIVLQEALSRGDGMMIQTHLAAAIAHAQAWEEVVANGMPFVIILEDDTVLNVNVRCLISSAIRRLPSAWDLLYLDISSDHYWPHQNIQSACMQAIKSSNESIFQVSNPII